MLGEADISTVKTLNLLELRRDRRMSNLGQKPFVLLCRLLRRMSVEKDI